MKKYKINNIKRLYSERVGFEHPNPSAQSCFPGDYVRLICVVLVGYQLLFPYSCGLIVHAVGPWSA